MTRPVADDDRLGNNRQLGPILGFPAMTVPAGFTTDGLPVGIEFMARPFAEAMLFRLGYAYEQGTRRRRPPPRPRPWPVSSERDKTDCRESQASISNTARKCRWLRRAPHGWRRNS